MRRFGRRELCEREPSSSLGPPLASSPSRSLQMAQLASLTSLRPLCREGATELVALELDSSAPTSSPSPSRSCAPSLVLVRSSCQASFSESWKHRSSLQERAGLRRQRTRRSSSLESGLPRSRSLDDDEPKRCTGGAGRVESSRSERDAAHPRVRRSLPTRGRSCGSLGCEQA